MSQIKNNYAYASAAPPFSDPMSTNHLASMQHYRTRRPPKKRVSCSVLVLMVLLGVAVAAVIIMAIFLIKWPEELKDSKGSVVLTKSGGSDSPDNEVCLTDGCIEAAARINQYLDTSVDPCDDFYQFACGGWEKMNTIPQNKAKLTGTSELQTYSKYVVKKILEQDKKLMDPGYIKKVKDFYSSCVNQDEDRQALQVLRDVIETDFGGWPLISNSWDESTISLEKAVLEASRHNVQTLCDFSIIPLATNKSLNVLRANQPILFSLGYRVSYRVDRTDPTLLALENRIFEVARTFGVSNETLAREEVAAMVDFEQQLVLISNERARAVVLEWPLSVWEERYDSEVLNWTKFFVEATATPDIGIYDLRSDESTYRGPNTYFNALRDLVLATPKRTVVNFIVWRVIDTYWSIASNNKTDEELTQWETSAAREEACLEYVAMDMENDLVFAASRIFLNEKFSDKDSLMVSNMIPWLKEAAIELMDKLQWIDTEALELTKEKFNYTKAKLGYPESKYTEDFLEKYYSNVTYTRDNYLKNLVTMKRDAWMKMVRTLRVPNGPDDLWKFLPIHVNAYSDVRANTIEFPAAIFQIPYFSGKNPKSLNYGAIGAVIGHELTHGCDTTGIQFDKYGNTPWWNATQRENFDRQTQCLIDQYNNFAVREVNMSINGKQTLNENIPDNAGVRQSFRAYRNWVASQGREEAALPGLKYTHDQLYFIARAHIYCTLMRKEEAMSEVQGSGYAHGRYRIIGPNQNSEDFAKAFNCPVNSYMNPANKCVIW